MKRAPKLVQNPWLVAGIVALVVAFLTASARMSELVWMFVLVASFFGAVKVHEMVRRR